MRRIDQDTRHAGGVFRWILAVTVKRDDNRGARRKQAGAHGRALAGVLPVMQHAQLREGRRRFVQARQGRIFRRVVDENDLEFIVREGPRENRSDLAGDLYGSAFFVIDGHHGGDEQGHKAGFRFAAKLRLIRFSLTPQIQPFKVRSPYVDFARAPLPFWLE